MKKLLLFGVIPFGLIACGQDHRKDALSIETEKLNTACECSDAIVVIMTEMKPLLDKVDGEYEMAMRYNPLSPNNRVTEDDAKLFNKLHNKYDSVNKHCGRQKSFNTNDIKECDSWTKVEELMKGVH